MTETPVGNTSRIILALDVEDAPGAIRLMERTHEQIRMVKIGLQLINAQLAGVVAEYATLLGLEIFWDGKFDDIPNTVEQATRAASRFNPRFINVHASAGVLAMKGATAAALGKRIQVLAVTALTSLNEPDTKRSFARGRKETVEEFAYMAVEAGVDGIVCSAKELVALKSIPQMKNLVMVIPGTRSVGAKVNDQANVVSPTQAILDGADWLVIGREMTDHRSPADVAKRINEDVAEAMEKRALRTKEVTA